MGTEIQKASMWKRISAWLFDSILLISVVVLIAYALSGAFGYDKYTKQFNAAYEHYETQYNVKLGEPEAPEDATQAEKDAYKERYALADAALKADKTANRTYGIITNFMILIPTFSLLVAMLLMEFVIPLMFGNGQTLGKKIFSLGVVRVDAVKLTTMQLFVRTVLSKYTVGMMVPLYMVLLTFIGVFGLGLIIALGLLLGQLLWPLLNRDHRGMHDMLSGTVVVDLPSQRVFADVDERTQYIQKEHAERAARQSY